MSVELMQISEKAHVRKKEEKEGKGKNGSEVFFCPYDLERAIQFQCTSSEELILPQVLCSILLRQIILILFFPTESRAMMR